MGFFSVFYALPPVPPSISKLMDAIPDHHWCIPFSVSGNPQPKLHWLLRKEPLIEGAFISTRIHDYSEHEYHGCLQLDSPTHINNGEYTLLASNPYGRDRKSIFAHFMHNPWNGEFSVTASNISNITLITLQHDEILLFVYPGGFRIQGQS